MPLTPTTWNSADKDPAITLSNGNRTAASTNAGIGGVRSVFSVSSGKWYWEYTVNTANAREIVGVANAAWATSTLLGNSTWSYGFFAFDGKKRNGAVATAYGSAFGNTSVISVLLDMDAGTLTFWVNGVTQGQAFSGLVGPMFAAFSGGSGSFTEQVTANFGGSAFVYVAPAGFNTVFGSDEVVEPPPPPPVDGRLTGGMTPFGKPLTVIHELISSLPIAGGQPYIFKRVMSERVANIKAGDVISVVGDFELTTAQTFTVMSASRIIASTDELATDGVLVAKAMGQNFTQTIHHYCKTRTGYWTADQDYPEMWFNFILYVAAAGQNGTKSIDVEGYGQLRGFHFHKDPAP